MNHLIAVLAIVLVSALWWVFPPGARPQRVLHLEPYTIAREPLRMDRHPLPPPVLAAIVDPNWEAMPSASYRYRRMIELAATRAFPNDPPVALLAAQVRAESAYAETARSHAGAQGIAQFMPRTALAMARLYPELRPAAPRDPGWALRAQALHMRDLVALYPSAASTCDRYAFALSAYNGGPLALARERAMSRNTSIWFGSVDVQRSRTHANWNENRGYVRRILLQLEPRYERAGWGGGLGCSA